MKMARRKRLKESGWKVGAAGEFLGLSSEEAAVVEMKLALSDRLRVHRVRKGLTQGALARKIGSSQSRIAKLEAGAVGVSLDLLFRALFAAGVTPRDIARHLVRGKPPAAA